jgi:hypothetical protein
MTVTSHASTGVSCLNIERVSGLMQAPVTWSDFRQSSTRRISRVDEFRPAISCFCGAQRSGRSASPRLFSKVCKRGRSTPDPCWDHRGSACHVLVGVNEYVHVRYFRSLVTSVAMTGNGLTNQRLNGRARARARPRVRLRLRCAPSSHPEEWLPCAR